MSLDASPQPAGRGLAHELRLVGTAWQFLTRWPLPARVSAWIGFQPAWLAECVRHFPLVGMVVGAWAALVLAASSQAWPPVVAVILSLIASLWLTGPSTRTAWPTPSTPWAAPSAGPRPWRS